MLNDNEVTSLLMTYRMHPDQAKASEVFEYINQNSAGVLRDTKTELPFSAAVLALAELHSIEALGWRQRYSDIFRLVVQKAVPQYRPGWNDWHAVRFGILGQMADAEAIYRATKKPPEMRGPDGGNARANSAHWLIYQILEKFDGDGAFRKALTKLGWFGFYAKGV